jgi:hypothetical protein
MGGVVTWRSGAEQDRGNIVSFHLGRFWCVRTRSPRRPPDAHTPKPTRWTYRMKPDRIGVCARGVLAPLRLSGVRVHAGLPFQTPVRSVQEPVASPSGRRPPRRSRHGGGAVGFAQAASGTALDFRIQEFNKRRPSVTQCNERHAAGRAVGFTQPTSGTAYIEGFNICGDMDRIYTLMGVCPQVPRLSNATTLYK